MAGIKSDIILNDNMSAVLRDIKNNVESCLKAMGDMEKGGEKAFEKLGGVLKGVGKVAKVMGTAAVAGITAAGAAVGKITKDAVESYSSYEQLVGGVETLFGNGGLTLKQFAKQEGQTVAAARSQYKELTAAQNEALKNANDAYKTAGMSANEYMETATSFAASLVSSLDGDTTKAVKYADMAIIDMADNLNKMGGSDISSIQAAYQGFAKGQYNMLDNLKLGYGGTAREMARLVNESGVLGSKKIDLDDTKNLGNALSEVGFAKITEAIHEVQKEMGILGTTKNEAEQTIQGSMSMMKASWQNMLTALVTGGDQYEQCVQNLVNSVTVFGKNILPVVEQALNGVGNLISDLAPVIAEKLPGMLQEVLPGLILAATSVISSLGSALPGIIQAFIDVVPELLSMLDVLVNVILDNLPLFLEAAIQIGIALINGLAERAPQLSAKILEMVWQLLQILWNNAGPFLEAGIKLIVGLLSGIGQKVGSVIEKIKNLGLKMIDKIKSFLGDMKEAGKNLIRGLWEGISDKIGWVIERVKGVGSRIMNAIKGVFGIHSPSKEFAMIGDYLMQGLGNGVTDNAKYAISATQSVARDVLDAASGLSANAQIGATFTGVTDNAKYAISATQSVARDVLDAASNLSANAQIGATFTGVTGSMSDFDGGTYDIMRNYAAQDSVNKFTTAQINIDMGGITNQIADGNDVDELITRFVDGVRERLSTASQGVH